MTFFERQPKLTKPFPEAADADLGVVLFDEPALQFGERRVGLARDAGAQGLVMHRELRLGAARPRARAGLAVLRRRPRALWIYDTLT